ncbi:Acid protease [Mycena venus]|uniref:Acid protease n=1 Tax=Mycena venus TaxID=2733690 RepID=A0A8H7D8V4_9AGAR|nr:Acid protease [Mycena venus]
MWSSFKFCLPVLAAALAERANALAVEGSPRSHSDRRAVFTVLGNATEDNVINERYTVNITVNGRNFQVAIDTGSTDLWIVTPPDFQFNDTGIPVVDSYGDGETTNVVGTIGFATVQLGGYTVLHQAYNNANASKVGLGDIVNRGLDGLMGFNVADGYSPIQETLKSSNLDPSPGASFLSNIFDQSPDQQNFLGVSLSRTDDLEGSADASFLINEVDPNYANVVSAPAIPLFPGTNGRWSVLIDGISVDGVSIPVTPSTVQDAPAGKVVALMDTGTPGASFPADFLDRLFGAIPGSVVHHRPNLMLA